MDDKKKMVMTSDNILAKVNSEEVIHILSNEADELIKKIYNTDVLSFARRWYNAMPIVSMGFYYLKLEKYEGKCNEHIETDCAEYM